MGLDEILTTLWFIAFTFGIQYRIVRYFAMMEFNHYMKLMFGDEEYAPN